MITTRQPLPDYPIHSLGHRMPTDPGSFGWLRRTDESAEGLEELRKRLREDGYLYLPGFRNRETVRSVRSGILAQLGRLGFLRSGTEVEDGVYDPDNPPPAMARAHPLDQKDPALRELLFGRPTMDFYASLLGGEATHFDFTWFRTKGTGRGSDIHCDVVYMGRGTKDLLSMWTPLGDIDLRMGGLTILEGSHRRSDLLDGYLERDVDRYCENKEDAAAIGVENSC
jgi:hypothetical protein